MFFLDLDKKIIVKRQQLNALNCMIDPELITFDMMLDDHDDDHGDMMMMVMMMMTMMDDLNESPDAFP